MARKSGLGLSGQICCLLRIAGHLFPKASLCSLGSVKTRKKLMRLKIQAELVRLHGALKRKN